MLIVAMTPPVNFLCSYTLVYQLVLQCFIFLYHVFGGGPDLFIYVFITLKVQFNRFSVCHKINQRLFTTVSTFSGRVREERFIFLISLVTPSL